MNRNLRILGVVACLLVLWMVVRGTNGCAMPPPDEKCTIRLLPEAGTGNEADFNGAKVYSGAKLLENKNLVGHATITNSKQLHPTSGDGTFELTWYTALEGHDPEVMLTIIHKDDESKHTHVWIQLDDDTPTLADKELNRMTQ